MRLLEPSGAHRRRTTTRVPAPRANCRPRRHLNHAGARSVPTPPPVTIRGRAARSRGSRPSERAPATPPSVIAADGWAVSGERLRAENGALRRCGARPRFEREQQRPGSHHRSRRASRRRHLLNRRSCRRWTRRIRTVRLLQLLQLPGIHARPVPVILGENHRGRRADLAEHVHLLRRRIRQ